MKTVRAKFQVDSVMGFGGTTTTPPTAASVTLRPVTANSEENAQFFEATPSGQISMYIKGSAALGFEPGKAFYVDFTPAE